MAAPEEEGKAGGCALTAKGAEFYDAVVTALEVARRGLVWEHERVLESREAGLWNEITRLNKELAHARNYEFSKRLSWDFDTVDLSMELDEGTDTCQVYKTEGFRPHNHWFRGKSPHDDEICHSVAPSPQIVGSQKTRRDENCDNWQRPWTEEESSVDDSDEDAATGCEAKRVTSTPWSDVAKHISGSGSKADVMVSEKPDSHTGSHHVGRISHFQNQRGQRMSMRQRISQLSSPTDMSPTSRRCSTLSSPGGGGQCQRFSQLSACPTESDEHPYFTWRRTADTVIMKAGSDFFMDSAPSLQSAHRAFCNRLRRDKTFQFRTLETVMGFVILLNCTTIGLSSELRQNWVGWIVVDSVFAGIFTLELIWKFVALGVRGYFVGIEWRWNIFEFVLVAMAWMEVASALSAAEERERNSPTSKSSLFRMLRLMRLAKLLRILRLQMFCDLLMMLNGAVGSWKTLIYSMVLVCIPLYGVSLILKETLGIYAGDGLGAENFQQLDQAFFTLFRCIVAGECTQEDGKPIFVMVTKTYGFGYGLIYCLVQFFMTFGLFNVIVAIYVENTVSAAKFNDISVKRQRLRDREFFEEKAEELLKMIWRFHCARNLGTAEAFDEEQANRLCLTQDFFDDLILQPSFVDLLRDLDISDDDQMDLFETLDVEGLGKIDLNDFVIGIGKLRGEARKADVIGVALMLRSLQHKLLHLEGRLSFMMKKPSKDHVMLKRGSTDRSTKRFSGEFSFRDSARDSSARAESARQSVCSPIAQETDEPHYL